MTTAFAGAPGVPPAELPEPPPVALTLALARSLAARLCHDVAGSLGTLSGALELAADDEAFGVEALGVARDAAQTLNRRLRLLRAAWGDGSEATDLPGLKSLASGLPAGRRIQIRLDALPPRAFDADAVRMLLALLLVAVESLAGEGVVQVAEAADDALLIVISGPRATWPSGFALQLADPRSALGAATQADPRVLAAPLAALVAHAAGRRVTMLMGAADTPAPPLLVPLA